MAKKPKPRPDGRYQVKRMVDGKAKFFYGATYDEAEAAARAKPREKARSGGR